MSVGRKCNFPDGYYFYPGMQSMTARESYLTWHAVGGPDYSRHPASGASSLTQHNLCSNKKLREISSPLKIKYM